MSIPTRESVIQAVSEYVNTKFDGNWERAFEVYGIYGQLGKVQVVKLLKDSNAVGPVLRGSAADMIMEELDANHDGFITLTEFKSIAD